MQVGQVPQVEARPRNETVAPITIRTYVAKAVRASKFVKRRCVSFILAVCINYICSGYCGVFIPTQGSNFVKIVVAKYVTELIHGVGKSKRLLSLMPNKFAWESRVFRHLPLWIGSYS